MRGKLETLEVVVSSWLFVHINSWCSRFLLQILGTTQKTKDRSSQAAVACARASATISTPAGSTVLLCKCPPFFVTPGFHVTAGRGARVQINIHWTCLCSLAQGEPQQNKETFTRGLSCLIQMRSLSFIWACGFLLNHLVMTEHCC